MAYNGRNLLNKIIDIQDTVLREQKRGATQIWVYNNIIYPKYIISFSTFNNYLSRNAKKELEEMDNRKKKQLIIEFD